jgi:hypothetical protein
MVHWSFLPAYFGVLLILFGVRVMKNDGIASIVCFGIGGVLVAIAIPFLINECFRENDGE